MSNKIQALANALLKNFFFAIFQVAERIEKRKYKKTQIQNVFILMFIYFTNSSNTLRFNASGRI